MKKEFIRVEYFGFFWMMGNLIGWRWFLLFFIVGWFCWGVVKELWWRMMIFCGMLRWWWWFWNLWGLCVVSYEWLISFWICGIVMWWMYLVMCRYILSMLGSLLLIVMMLSLLFSCVLIFFFSSYFFVRYVF